MIILVYIDYPAVNQQEYQGCQERIDQENLNRNILSWFYFHNKPYISCQKDLIDAIDNESSQGYPYNAITPSDHKKTQGDIQSNLYYCGYQSYLRFFSADNNCLRKDQSWYYKEGINQKHTRAFMKFRSKDPWIEPSRKEHYYHRYWEKEVHKSF